jgi:stearoyl-CoA desaturase (Delta-9 desaturase)
MKTKQNKINWLNTIFLILTPIIGIAGTALLCSFGMVMWQTWVLFGVAAFLAGLGITAGYHRLFSHVTYNANPIVRFVITMLGSSAFEGSVFEWSSDHRNHHRYVDTEKDPYNINQGFWYAHMGWLIRLDTSKRDFSNIKDLTASRFLRFQHKYFSWIAAFTGIILPALIASLWGNALAGLIVGGVLRVVVTMHSTFLINSLCHYMGSRPYSNTQTARDNWVTALLTCGEGYHNYHHQFALDYRNGVRYFQFDPTKWFIFALSKVGLTNDLKRIDASKILAYRLKTEEERLKQRFAHDNTFLTQKVEPLKTNIAHLLAKISELELELVALKKVKVDYVKERYHTYKELLGIHVSSLKSARKELAHTLTYWRSLAKV